MRFESTEPRLLVIFKLVFKLDELLHDFRSFSSELLLLFFRGELPGSFGKLFDDFELNGFLRIRILPIFQVDSVLFVALYRAVLLRVDALVLGWILNMNFAARILGTALVEEGVQIQRISFYLLGAGGQHASCFCKYK
jgi:hypothetical protein